ncbi:CAN2 protein, partial [Polypterus senegalus]
MANTLQEQGSRENPIKFKNQDYQSLKSECLKSKKLFEDPEFPTVQESIGLPVDSDPSKAVVWLRPKEPWNLALPPHQEVLGVEKQGHPECFREYSQHIRLTVIAGEHLEHIWVWIKGAASLHSRLESGEERTKQEKREWRRPEERQRV